MCHLSPKGRVETPPNYTQTQLRSLQKHVQRLARDPWGAGGGCRAGHGPSPLVCEELPQTVQRVQLGRGRKGVPETPTPRGAWPEAWLGFRR